jgi:hypothetical protein
MSIGVIFLVVMAIVAIFIGAALVSFGKIPVGGIDPIKF